MSTILVIDDERLLCDLFQEVLRRQGLDVFTAYSGREGIAAYRRHRPRFTILDLHLPDMKGTEVLRQIREMDPNSAIMVMTGAASDQLEREARELGITDFLTKGLEVDVFIDAVRRAMHEAPRPASAQPVFRKDPSILVVDDEPQIRDLLTQYLSSRHYRVQAAQDGPAALTSVDMEPPDLVVLDMHMPGMTGIELFRKLRARHYTGGIMMLTSSQDENLIKEARDLGALDIVGKPADLERIELAIQVSLILSAVEHGDRVVT
jgi:DNA-binding response OmpR family regulator